MESLASGASVGSVGLNGNNVDISENVASHVHPLEVLCKNQKLDVNLLQKGFLVHVMDVLGAKRHPVFTKTNCGDGGVIISIKLYVSDLPTSNGERISYSIVEGAPSRNSAIAESNAVMMAFKHLEQNHLVKIVDLSSRLLQKYESFGLHEMVVDGMRSLETIFNAWEMTNGCLENFAVELQVQQSHGKVISPLSPLGKIYALVGNNLTSVLNSLHGETSSVRIKLSELEVDRLQHENRKTLRGQLSLNMAQRRQVGLDCKDVLEYVMNYLGLDEPDYTNSPDPYGMVKSSVKLTFPEIKDQQFGGNMKLTGKGYSSKEAEEDAALGALVFINKHFKVQICDFNHSECQNLMKENNSLLEMLSKIIEVSAELKMMWLKLNSVLKVQIGLFHFDPSDVFKGTASQAHIKAYKFCGDGLKDVEKQSMKELDSVAYAIEALEKLSWKLLDVETKLSV